MTIYESDTNLQRGIVFFHGIDSIRLHPSEWMDERYRRLRSRWQSPSLLLAPASDDRLEEFIDWFGLNRPPPGWLEVHTEWNQFTIKTVLKKCRKRALHCRKHQCLRTCTSLYIYISLYCFLNWYITHTKAPQSAACMQLQTRYNVFEYRSQMWT